MTNSQKLLGFQKRKEYSLYISKGDVRMRKVVRLSTMTGPHKPLVTGSNPVAASLFEVDWGQN